MMDPMEEQELGPVEETVEAQASPEATTEVQDQAAAPPAEPAAPAPEGIKEPFWYRQEIKRREKEARELKRQLEEYQQRAEAAPAYAPSAADAYVADDPRVWASQAELAARIAIGEDMLREKIGDDQFEDLDAWLRTRPDVVQTAHGKPNPWRYAHQVYQKERTLAEIGDDPSAYRERLKAELLAELRQQQPASGAMGGNPPQLPRNASAQRSAGARPSGIPINPPLEEIFRR